VTFRTSAQEIRASTDKWNASVKKLLTSKGTITRKKETAYRMGKKSLPAFNQQ
jgi:hypothetical protein